MPPAPIQRLPNELVCAIVWELNLEDVFHFTLSCRHFHHLFADASMCRMVVEKHAPFSEYREHIKKPRDHKGPPDASDRPDYAKILRILYKRQQAVSLLQPFSAAVVAFADSHLYVNQTLLYVRGRKLHILSLQIGTTVRRETVVDVRALLDEALCASRGTKRYSFRLLHYAHGIVSAVYAHRRQEHGQPDERGSWLVLFEPATGWTTCRRLDLPHHHLFVRNDKSYLVYGTYTAHVRRDDAIPDAAPAAAPAAAINTDAHRNNSVDSLASLLAQAPMATDYGDGDMRRWVLWRFDLVHRIWCEQGTRLDEVLGVADLGSGLCFDIIDGYFYAVANQQRPLEHYDPLYSASNHADDDGHDGHEGHGGHDGHDDHDSHDSHIDSDIDDMDPSQRSANPYAVHSYYTCFRFPLDDPGRIEKPTLASLWRRRNDEGAIDERWTSLRVEKSAATGQIFIVEARKEWPSGESGSRRSYYMQPLVWKADRDRARALASSQLQTPAPTPTRVRHRTHRTPDEVHIGDDSASAGPLTISDCVARFYSTTTATFLDLFNQPTDGNRFSKRRLVLRAGSRKPRPPRGREFRSREFRSGVDDHGTGLLVQADKRKRDDDKKGRAALSAGQLDVVHTKCTRREGQLDVHGDTSSCSSGADSGAEVEENPLYPLCEINRRFVTCNVVSWPPPPDTPNYGDPGPRSSALSPPVRPEALMAILNPPNFHGAVTAEWDDRLLVYARSEGGSDGRQAIVVVSFDPTLCLSGLARWTPLPETRPSLTRATTHADTPLQRTPCECATSEGPNDKANHGVAPADPAGCKGAVSQGRPGPRWASSMPPQYLEINQGYEFSA